MSGAGGLDGRRLAGRRLAGRRLALLAILISLLVLVSIPIAVVAVEPSAAPAEPSAIPAGLLERGDPRSEGSGAGLVGSPFLVLVGVVGLGLLTASATVVIERLTRRA